jgi:RNA polymerase sigma-70 factor (ECF subfamily)
MACAFTLPEIIVSALRPAIASETSSDALLIKQIARGHESAMRILFARHRLYVYRFVLRMVRDETMAEDLLSDVFLDVWRKASQFEGRSAVSTWLLAVARLKALSALRRRADVALDDEVAANIPDPAHNPETALAHKRTAEVFRHALAKLSPAQSEVINLVYDHGKSISEVAQIVGVSDATVKTCMFYTRKKLAEIVQSRTPSNTSLKRVGTIPRFSTASFF